jgi:transcriptional regulator with GAF, ATPase, and Fis domain
MNGAIKREEEKKAILKLKTLYEIAKVLISPLDLEEAYPSILSVLASQMGMRRGAFLVMNSESNEWEVGAAHGLSAEEMKRRKEYFGSGIIQRILEKGQMAAVVDGGESIWTFDGKAKTGIKRANTSFLCAPVKTPGGIAGILGVDHLFEEPMAPIEDFHFLQEVCSLISEALLLRKAMAAETRSLLEENWGFRKELENLGRSVPKARKEISLKEILEERLGCMFAEMKVESRSKSHLYDDVLNVVERTLIKSALEKTKHVQLKASRFLGINRNTLRKKLKELGIPAKEK